MLRRAARNRRARRRARSRGPVRRRSPCSTPPSSRSRLRRTRAGHLDPPARRAAAGDRCSTCPYLFTRTTACAPRSSVAEALGAGAGVLMAERDERRRPARGSLEQLLAAKEIVIHCGSGGVGKTTTAAAAAADGRGPPRRQGARAHRRPGQAAGQRARPRAVRQRRDAGARPRLFARGRRRAARRAVGGDARHQAVVGRPRPPPRARRRRPATRSSPTRSTRTSPASSCRATTTSRWSGSTRSTASGRYDLIVVDTPPTRNAIDFLEAPERMADFFSQPAAALAHRARTGRGWSTARRSPSTRSPTASSARSSSRTSPSSSSCSRRCTTASSSGRDAVDPHARGPAHHVRRGVARSKSAPVREAEFFIDALRRAATSTSARSCSTRCCRRTSSIARRRRRRAALCARRRRRSRASSPTDADAAVLERVLREVGESFLNYQVVATREAEPRAELASHPRRRGHRPVLRHRHLRPRRPAPARRADLALSDRRDVWPMHWSATGRRRTLTVTTRP